jgi:hypothetical protein
MAEAPKRIGEYGIKQQDLHAGLFGKRKDGGGVPNR